MSPRKDFGLPRCARNDGVCGGGIAPANRIFIVDILSQPRGSSRPSFASLRPSNERGRREDRVPDWHLGSTVRYCKERLHSGVQVKPKHPAFPAQWFYGLCRDLPGERCTIPRRLADRQYEGPIEPHASGRALTHRLGRQDHTILPYAVTPVVRAMVLLTVARQQSLIAPT